MNILYSDPVVNEDGTILIEQVSILGADELPNGIKRRELKVIQELYPDLDLLNLTMEKAKENYANTEMQGDKTVAQLEQEKKALEGLLKAVAKL